MQLSRPFAAATLIAFMSSTPGLASAQESLEVSFLSTEAGGNYAPDNVLAVWIETDTGDFVKTIGRWSDRRTQHLVAWVGASGQDTDAVSGATRSSHAPTMTVGWDMRDAAGLTVADGNYVVRMELADRNSSLATENNQGTFAFVKDGAPSSQTVAGGGFESVSIVYTGAVNDLCDNGQVDPGETCDPPGSCPTSCQESTDLCVPVTLTGSADNCDAACVEAPIATCIADDGCGPDACNQATDTDCAGEPGEAVRGEPITGSCSSGGSGAGLLASLLLLVCVGLLRRRRSAA